MRVEMTEEACRDDNYYFVIPTERSDEGSQTYPQANRV